MPVAAAVPAVIVTPASGLRQAGKLDHAEGIAVARRDYIEAVRVYNTALRTFPSVLWATLWFTDNKPFENFTASEGATEPPKVDFN